MTENKYFGKQRWVCVLKSGVTWCMLTKCVFFTNAICLIGVSSFWWRSEVIHPFQLQHATQWPKLNCFVQTNVHAQTRAKSIFQGRSWRSQIDYYQLKDNHYVLAVKLIIILTFTLILVIWSMNIYAIPSTVTLVIHHTLTSEKPRMQATFFVITTMEFT